MKIIEPHLYCRIRGFGRSWPQSPAISNKDLLKRFPEFTTASDFKLEAMARRLADEVGVQTRYLTHFPGTPLDPAEETTESLALRAAQNVLHGSENLVEALIHGTTTTRRYSGSQAAAIAGQLGLGGSPAYEMKAGCSTSLASLHMAWGLLAMGYRNVLVSVAETMSKIAHPLRRDDWFGVGDGSAALWIETTPVEQAQFIVEKSIFSTFGQLVDLYTTPGDLPPRQDLMDRSAYFLQGDAMAMRTHVKKHYTAMLKTLLPNNADRQAVRWIVPHQVNRQIIDEVLKELELSGEVLWSADRFGNLGGTSVIFTLAEAFERSVFQSGDRVLLMSVGGGLSCAAQIWQF